MRFRALHAQKIHRGDPLVFRAKNRTLPKCHLRGPSDQASHFWLGRRKQIFWSKKIREHTPLVAKMQIEFEKSGTRLKASPCREQSTLGRKGRKNFSPSPGVPLPGPKGTFCDSERSTRKNSTGGTLWFLERKIAPSKIGRASCRDRV